jgi:hypothetical protein
LQSAEAAGTGSTGDGKPYTVDSVTLTGTANGTYNSKDVPSATTVTFGGLSLTGTGSGNYGLTASTQAAAITAKALTVTGLSANDKVYNATTAATLSGTAALLAAESSGTGTTGDGKPYTGDTVNVTGTPSGTFASKNVGTGIGVSVSGLSLSGAQAADYSLTPPSLSASISAATLTYVANAASRFYGAANPALSGTVPGFAGTDTQANATTGTLTFTTTATTTSPIGSYAINGSGLTANNGNYTFVQAGGNATALAVTRLPVNLTGTRVYDATTTVTAAILSVANKVGSDDVTVASGSGTLANKTVGSQAISSLGTLALGGATAGNYTLSEASGSVTITTATVTATVTASDKMYDATTTATITAALTGVLDSDHVNLTAPATGTFSTKDAGNSITVTVTGMKITGPDSGNYTLANSGTATTTANITPKALTMGGLSVPSSRTYDGTTTASVSGTPTLQAAETPGTGTTTDGKPYSGDAVTISGTATTTYNSKNVSSATTVTFGGLSLNGAQFADYSLTIQAPAAAAITPATLTYTANAVSRAYGSANPLFSGTVSGFVTSENQGNATTGTLTFASAATSSSPAGSYAVNGSGLTANNGNYAFVQAAGNATALTITAAGSATSVVSSPSPACFGDSVTFTATVTDNSPASSGTPPGTVTFKDGAATLGTGTLNGSGTATLATSSLTAGSHTITAVYGGDGNFTGSTSGNLSQNINPTSVGGTATASPNPVCYSNSTTVTLAGNTGAIQWQSSSNNVDWVDITGQTGQTLTTENLTGTAYYRAKVTSGVCAASFSSVATVTIETTPPTISNCPSDINTNTGPGRATCDQVVTWTPPTATDDCPGTTLTSDHSPGDTFPVGTTKVTYTATATAGNTASCSFNVTVLDTTAPVLAGVPSDATASCNNIPVAAAVTATDNCDPAPKVTLTETSTQDQDATVIGHYAYTITRTWMATDASGNSTKASQTISVSDTAKPVLAGQGSATTIECPASPVFTAPTASDNCDPNPVVTFTDTTTPGDCAGTYSVTRTWTAEDVSGNVSLPVSQTITVKDTTPPVITGFPADIAVSCAGAVPPADDTLVTATDACNGATITHDPDVITAQTCANRYIITRTYHATDACGNTSGRSQTIKVDDESAPTIVKGSIASCFKTLAAADDAAQAATAGTGFCGDGLTFTATDNGQKCPATITVKGTDSCGNSATVTYTATILTAPPVLTGCPAPTLLVHCPADIPLAAVVTAKDACGTALTVSFSESNPGNTCTNVITRTWTTTDCAGNVNSCSQTITLHQDGVPIVTKGTINSCYKTLADADAAAKAATTGTGACSDALTFAVSDNGQTCPATITVTGTDACGNSASVNYTATVLTTPPVLTSCPAPTLLVHCPADIPLAAIVTAKDACGTALTVNFSESNPGNTCTNVITRTWTTTDCAGNVNSCSQTVTLHQDGVPTVTKGTINTCYKTLADADAAAKAATTGSGACSDALTFTVGDNGQTCPATITVTGTDACGNSASVTYTATILTTPPVSTGCPAPTLLVHCPADIPLAAVVTAKDACGTALIVNFSETNPGNTCTNVITRTWTTTDCAGNVNSCIQTITLHQDGVPTVTRGTINSCYKTLADADAAAKAATTGTGACSDALTFTVGDNGQTCPATITVTGTDACGNSTSVTYTATILTTPPVLTGCPAPTVLVHCPADIPPAVTVTAKDACNTGLTVNFAVTQSNPGGCTNVITRTWTTTDCAGNTSSCTQVVTLHTDGTPSLTKGTIGSCYKTLASADAAAKAATTGIGSCTQTLTFTVSDNGQTCPATITVTGTDPCGNSASVTYTATILTTPPVLSGCPAPTASYECYSLVPQAPTVTAKDACGNPLTVTPAETQSNPGSSCHNTITRTWTTTDCAGNVSTCTQVITVNDDIAPSINLIGLATMTPYYLGAFVDPGVTVSDNCVSLTVTTNVALWMNNAWQPVAAVNTGVAGLYQITYTVTDACGNHATATRIVNAEYQPAGLACGGNPGHTILQPINADGTSVCKQGSTVPAKFMVFDANCSSIGTPGVVANFVLYQIKSGTVVNTVNETVDSTTPDTAFRWDPTGQQWIFNISTKSLLKNNTYIYQVTLNDGTTIMFQFGLK